MNGGILSNRNPCGFSEEVMRTTIRSDQVYEARQSIPSRISLAYSPSVKYDYFPSGGTAN